MKKVQRITVIGNYAPDSQQSMLRFGRLMNKGYEENGIESELIQPQAVFTKLLPRYKYSGIPKLIGYIDKFILFPKKLREIEKSKNQDTLYHIADHSNSIYIDSLPQNRTFITCHDILQIKSAFIHNPNNPISSSGRKYQKWVANKLGEIQHIACISSKTLEDYKAIIPNHSSQNIRIILQCYNNRFERMPSDETSLHLKALDIPEGEPFLLHVGGNQWYKNRNGVIDIFNELRELNFPVKRLVMAGKPLTESQRARIQQYQLESAIANPQDISDQQIVALYSAAQALLFPSLEEGFGWPIIEALGCHCPVITSRRQPMQEIAQDSAIFIDPETPQQAALHISETWDDRIPKTESFQTRVDFFKRDRLICEYIEFISEFVA